MNLDSPARGGGPGDAMRELIALLQKTEDAPDDFLIGTVTQVSPLLVQAPGSKVVVADDGSLSVTPYTAISATTWTTMSIGIGQKVLLVRLPDINAWACIGRLMP